ncbi:LOW QUALITY PROTEIN: protein FAM124A-like [Elysia marginata]|uniref:Protein FAM124A-like n=1 Tax=Elysia marginata TaxID=1093978 RepID=A0AAV4I4G2_9GAST|nr:LOW QUALITY PROTEIN: protein FAM124A-like [Elysia marginata]
MDEKKNVPDTPKYSKLSCRRSASKAGVCLTLVVPPGKRKYMCRILKPIVRDVRGLASLIDVTEQPDDAKNQRQDNRSCAPSYTVSSQELSAPALAVMLFLPEHSQTIPDVTTVRQRFLEFPWRYHHAIQLQSAGATKSNLLGQQDFYFLSRQLPLWSVSAGLPQSGLRVRFNVFVRRFNAMVEFYRLITNSEMESRKAGFCVFPLTPEQLGEESVSSSCDKKNVTSFTCELALKQCPMVNPFPVSDAYLSFPVSNLKSLLSILPTQARLVSNHRYLIHDPDGNPLILYNSDHHKHNDVSSKILEPLIASSGPSHTRLVIDKSSEHEFSIDSGRYSDFETSSFELENCMSKMIEEVDLLKSDSGLHGNNAGETSSFELENCMSKMIEEVDLLKSDSGLHGNNAGIFSKDYKTEATKRSEQRWVYRRTKETNCPHPAISDFKLEDCIKSTSHKKCTQHFMNNVSLPYKNGGECNGLGDGPSKNAICQCRRKQLQHWLPWCELETCKKNVFPTDSLSNERTYFSETDL